MQEAKVNESKFLKSRDSSHLGSLFFEPILEMYVEKPNMLHCQELENIALFRRVVPLDSIQLSNIDGRKWLTGGVIVSKETKIQESGEKYIYWNMTNLKGDIAIVKVQLRGSACDAYEGVTPGTLVALLLSTTGDSGGITITMSDPKQVVILGKSAEYGICSKVTNNDETCSAIINVLKSKTCQNCSNMQSLPPFFDVPVAERLTVLHKYISKERYKGFITKHFPSSTAEPSSDDLRKLNNSTNLSTELISNVTEEEAVSSGVADQYEDGTCSKNSESSPSKVTSSSDVPAKRTKFGDQEDDLMLNELKCGDFKGEFECVKCRYCCTFAVSQPTVCCPLCQSVSWKLIKEN